MRASFSIPVPLPWIFRLALGGALLLFGGNFLGCKKISPPPAALFISHGPERSGVHFRNQLFESARLNILTWEYFYNGGGTAIGDFDRDGLPDLVFASNMGNCALYRNQGDFSFADLTDSAGIDTRGQWTTGISLVDLNADGWLDIYLSMAGPYPAPYRQNRLYLNQGDFTFVERAAQFGLADTGHSTQAVFFDYDRDGDLDCYLLTNMMEVIGPNVIRPKKTDGSSLNTDRLYRNDDGKFVDVSRAAGILKEGYGLGVTVTDLNEDGWPDLYVSNDYLSNDLLWINQGDGTFRDEAACYFRHTSYSAMGHDSGDLDGDGRVDLVTVDMLPATHERQKLMFGATNYDRFHSELRAGYQPQYMRNTWQLNQGLSPEGDPLFAEIGQLVGIHQTDWSWSVLMADLDLDSHRDLLITNGYPRDITNRDFADYKAGQLFGQGQAEVDLGQLAQKLAELPGVQVPEVAYRNAGELRFEDVSGEWGFTAPSYSHGMALGDLDGDGDLDVVINQLEAPAAIYENLAADRQLGHWLQLLPAGSPQNPGGFGLRVEAWAGSQHHLVEYNPVRGYQSCQAPGIFLGLGPATQLDSLHLRWPDGRAQRLTSVPAGQRLTVSWADAKVTTRPLPQLLPPALLTALDTSFFSPAFRHRDPEYPDFKVQPLLPHKHSEQGPCLAVGDVDGDGEEDFFVGGAFRQPGWLYRQQADGRFVGEALGAKAGKESEDLGSLLFDADNDGDLDLYVVSGSNELPLGHPAYQDRLYRNDGAGNFAFDSMALPVWRESGSCVVALDFDRDGDQDLFVGGRLRPQAYPEAGASVWLRNEGGRFEIAQQQKMGMVTGAVAADVDGDGWTDLAVAGEWLPLTIWYNREGRFETSKALAESAGWWQCLEAADLDGDGDLDLIAGNRGLNSRLQASPAQPVRLYHADVNGDGRRDPLMTHYLAGQEVPFASRDDLIKQVSELRRRFPDYRSFAATNWSGVLAPEQQAQLRVETVQTFASVWVENKGPAGWVVHPLPRLVQVAPICGIATGDVNADGHLDLLLTGNIRGNEVQTGAYDAMSGWVLLGDGNGGFQVLEPGESGLYLPGDGRDLRWINWRGGRLLLASENDGPLRGFRAGR